MCACAAHDHGALDIDVHALHQGYLRGARTQGAELVTNAEVTHLERRGERWVAVTPAGEFAAPIVVNAAGAWSDEIARMAGVRAVGLQPKRRTVAVVDPPPGVDIDAWPLVVDCEERWYFKPDAGRLLISPADETPVPPQDVRPEELDVAHAADRITRMTTLAIRHIRRSWAGLRSFVADRCPALGYATDTEGFFWLAGQGGYGIQTSHAMGLAAAALVLDGRLPDSLTAAGIDESELSPARL